MERLKSNTNIPVFRLGKRNAREQDVIYEKSNHKRNSEYYDTDGFRVAFLDEILY